MVATRSSSRLMKSRPGTPPVDSHDMLMRKRIPQLPDDIWAVIMWMRAMVMAEDERSRLSIKIILLRSIDERINPLDWVLPGEDPLCLLTWRVSPLWTLQTKMKKRNAECIII